jgi:hypothetical protein
MIIKNIILNSLWLFILLSSCDLINNNEDVQLNLKLDQQTYSVSDTLKGTFVVTNFSPNTVTFKFSSSCQYGLKIKSGNTVFREMPEICATVLTRLTLRSGQSEVYKFELILVDKEYNNLLQGDYEVEAFLLNGNSSAVSKSFTIN